MVQPADEKPREWTDDAVRLGPDSPVDVGKAAIYAGDLGCLAEAPGSAIVGFKPDIRDVRVVDEDWAVEWGPFDAEFRESAGRPLQTIHGKVWRILHRESRGDWKFSRVIGDLESESLICSPIRPGNATLYDRA